MSGDWIFFIILTLFFLIFGATAVYVFGFRPESMPDHVIYLTIRYPEQEDLLYSDGYYHFVDQRINVGSKVMTWISCGVYYGDIQNRLKIKEIPKIEVNLATNKINLLNLNLVHKNVDIGRRILEETQRLLMESETVHEILYTASILNANQALKNQQNLMVYTTIIDRLSIELNDKQETLQRLIRVLANLNRSFESEGSMYSEELASSRLSDKKLLGIFGVISLTIGIFSAFLMEVKARRMKDENQ